MSSSMRVSAIHQPRSPRFHSRSSSIASAMAIPGGHEAPPPPLPPPTYLPEISAEHDPGWQFANEAGSVDYGRQVKPGSSLFGRSTSTGQVDADEDSSTHYVTHNNAHRAHWARSNSILNMPPEYNLLGGSRTPSDGESSPKRANYFQDRTPSERQLGSERQLERRTLNESSQSYDKQLLSRIRGPYPAGRQSISLSSPHEIASQAQAEMERRGSQYLRPLSMPDQKQNPMLDSPSSARWSGAVSPRHSWAEHGPPDTRTTTSRHNSLAIDFSSSHRGSYDQSIFIHEDLLEEGPMSTLNIQDRSPLGGDDVLMGGPRAGSKRRASSPPREIIPEDRSSVSSASGQSDVYQRRPLQQLPPRDLSAISRFPPSHSSLSSTGSFGPRHNSLGSSLGVASIPSSATSYGSDRLSPNTLLPAVAADAPTQQASVKLGPPASVHQRALSDSTQAIQHSHNDTASHSRQSSMSHMQGVYMCECCPKKPKKFDSEDELRLHESEKQYSCQYCPNRFKNKNEAERHQNSLHLRHHSWSCAALSGVEAAFHASSVGNGADVCGYCGEEFPNPPQWDMRAEHLNHVHKFGECNQAKKFFRADHFRQHLKHSHAGTSGKWTNMLETACMKAEPLPEKRVNSMTAANATSPPALMIMTSGLSGPTPPGHRPIAQTSHEN